MRLVSSSIAIALLLSASAYAQKNTNPERVKALKPGQKDAKVVAYRHVSTYTYQLDGDNLVVVNDNTADLISLFGNVNHERHVFYNDNLKVDEAGLTYVGGKDAKMATTCGNYEVDDIFYSDAKVCTYRFNFLYEGTEMSFHSRERYNDPRYLTKIYFHDAEPTAAREISVIVPEYADVELVERNFEGFNIQKSVTKKDGKVVHTYKAENLTELKSESNSRGASYYYPHLIVLTKKYKTNSGEKTVLSSVDDLYKWYGGLVKQVKNDPAAFKDQVEKLTAGLKTPEEKIKAIYYWVQDNIKYIAFEDGLAGFIPEPAQKVYTNHYGDCKGMANLLKEMLKVAGFDARLTWIGTNRLPYTYDIPSLCVDNHMICTVSVAGKDYILDGTEKYMALGKNAERIQGKEMLIENGATYIRRAVPVSDFNANLINRQETLTVQGESLSGQGEIVLNGEARKNILYLSNHVKQEDQNKVFDRLAVSEYSNTDKVEITNTPPVDREKPLEVKYSFSLNNKVSAFDNDLYIELDWNKAFEELTMEDTRVSDFYFDRKVKQKTSKKLKVPAGYSVSHLPKGMTQKHENFTFEITYKLVGNEVIYNNEITVKNGLVKKADFAEWNKCIKELKDVYSDQLVLTKSK